MTDGRNRTSITEPRASTISTVIDLSSYERKINATNTVFVAKYGSDAFDGLSSSRPKQTLYSAIIVANSLSPSTYNTILIKILDGGIYSTAPSSTAFSLSAYVNIEGTLATITGGNSCNDDFIIELVGNNLLDIRNVVTNNNNTTGIKISGYDNVVKINSLVTSDTDHIGILNNGYDTYLQVENVETISENIAISNIGSLHANITHIRLTDDSMGIVSDGNINAHILEITQTDFSSCTALNLTANSVSNIFINEVTVSNLISDVIGATGILNIVDNTATTSTLLSAIILIEHTKLIKSDIDNYSAYTSAEVIKNIIRMTIADYNQMILDGTDEPNTFYITI